MENHFKTLSAKQYETLIKESLEKTLNLELDVQIEGMSFGDPSDMGSVINPSVSFNKLLITKHRPPLFPFETEEE